MRMTTFLPVLVYAALINSVNRSLLSAAGWVMPYSSSYSERRLPRYLSSWSFSMCLPDDMSNLRTGYSVHSFSTLSM